MSDNRIVKLVKKPIARGHDLWGRCNAELEKLEGMEKWEFTIEMARIS